MAISEQLEQKLQQWVAASVIDSPAADRIRNFESTHDSRGMRWPVVLAIAFGALMPRLRALGIALHGVGTAALGAGIFLAGQIFNLQEHWPGGILLWAIGAVLSWLVLRDWLQATLAALLVPAWIASEWGVRAQHFSGSERILIQFLAMLAVTYLSARRDQGKEDSHFRRALVWAGGIALLPTFAALAADQREWYWNSRLP